MLSRNDGARARHTLKRILTILKVMVAQLDILETMTPLEFLSFSRPAGVRQRIPVVSVPELEFALGWKDAKSLERYQREATLGGGWNADSSPLPCGTPSCITWRLPASRCPGRPPSGM